MNSRKFLQNQPVGNTRNFLVKKTISHLFRHSSLRWVDFAGFFEMISLTSESCYLYYYSCCWYSRDCVAADLQNVVSSERVQTWACRIARKGPMVAIVGPNVRRRQRAGELVVILVDLPTCSTVNFGVLAPLSQRFKHRRDFHFLHKVLHANSFNQSSFYHFSDGTRKILFLIIKCSFKLIINSVWWIKCSP